MMQTPRRTARPRAAARGFTLVELLVAVTLGMVLVLALTTVMIRHDSGKRTLISTNDLSLGTSYVSYALDRELRSAGSGFTRNWADTFGCLLHVSNNNTQVLPRTAAFPAPFAAVPQQVRLAPLLIHAGAGTGGSDVLAVATGAAGLGEAPIRVRPGSATASDLRVDNTVGLRAGDLVLVAEGGANCLLEQVAAPAVPYGASQVLSFGGTYADAEIAAVKLIDFGVTGTAFVSSLGNIAGNRPMLRLVGIGANATLVSLDMLQLDNDTPQPLVDGVVELRALYGVDTSATADGTIDAWLAPTAVGYTAAALSDGTAAARDRLMRILAVRVGMVLRSDRIERDAVAPASLTLFTDLPTAVQHTHAIATGERTQRFRTIEFTVPLRNVMIAARDAAAAP